MAPLEGTSERIISEKLRVGGAMGFLDLFSLFVLLVIIVVGVAIVLFLGWLPGNVATKRHSPWGTAIKVAGWLGILLPPLWMLALIAAFVKPRTGEGAAIVITESESAELAASLSAINQRITALEASLRTGGPRPSDPQARR